MALTINELTGLESLDENRLKQITVQLSYFAAKGSQTYVSDLIDFLVLNILAGLPMRSGHFPKEIHETLVKQTNFAFEFEQVLDSLERLVETKAIYATPQFGEASSKEFRIELVRQREITTQFHQQVKFEEKVMTEWREGVRQRHPDLKDDQLLEIEQDLEAFSLRLYSQHSVESVLLYTGDDKNVARLLEKMDFNSLREILPAREAYVRKARSLELPRFFYDAPIDRKIYIGKKLNQIFMLHMMQLDPKCAGLAKQTITGGTLFLDTNFVIRLLGIDGPELKEASKRLVKLSQGLGYTTVVTPKTISEYKYKLSDLLTRARSMPTVSPEVAEAALSSTASRDFHTHFWKRSKEAGGYLSLEVYFQIYQDVENLLKEYSVVIDDTDDLAIRNDRKALNDEIVLLRKYVENLEYTHDAVVEHDAHHRLLILRLRQGFEEKTPLEVPYWFLTCDTKLPVYDRRVRARPDNLYRFPYCVLSSQWMQLLRPFAGAVDEMAIVHADTLDSPLFRAFHNPPTELLQEIITRMSINQDIPPKAIARTITNDAFVRAFEKADEARKEYLIEDKVEDARIIKYQEEIANMNAEVSRLSHENSMLVTKLNNLTKNFEESSSREKLKKEEREAYKAQRQDLERQIRDLQKGYDIVQKQLSAAQSSKDRALNQNQALVASFDDLQNRIKQVTEENKAMLESSQAAIQTLQDALARERTEHEKDNLRRAEDIALFKTQQQKEFARQQKVNLVILIGISLVALMLALSPWRNSENVKYIPLVLFVAGLAMQIVAIPWVKLSKIHLGSLVVLNFVAAAIAISILFGFDGNATMTLVALALASVQALASAIDAVLHNRTQA
jgi:hypothetical protein